MVIVKIKGGLGNQLFTYATAYALSKVIHQDLMVDKYIYHTHYKLRDYKLDNICIKCERTLIKKSFGDNRFCQKFYRFYHFLLLLYHNPQMIVEKEWFSLQRFDIKKRTVYLDGYWQNYQYFHKYRGELVSQFIPRDFTCNCINAVKEIHRVSPIAMHVRRGDYKTFRNGSCLNESYYQKAITIFREKWQNIQPIWIFTDDIPFCKETFSQYENIVYFGEKYNLSDVEELYCMSKCHDFIIANSTYSWWAAYLNEQENTKVICPVFDIWKKSFYPQNWYPIDVNE